MNEWMFFTSKIYWVLYGRRVNCILFYAQKKKYGPFFAGFNEKHNHCADTEYPKSREIEK